MTASAAEADQTEIGRPVQRRITASSKTRCRQSPCSGRPRSAEAGSKVKALASGAAPAYRKAV